jgi:L-asparaginase
LGSGLSIKFVTTGGTIDKLYFDAKDEYEVGPPQVAEILRNAGANFSYEILSILRKDSLDLTDSDRAMIRERVAAETAEHIIITHGTDTMVQTALALREIPGKTIVLTGSMQPARFRVTDAEFNLGAAVAAVQILPHGVYIVMQGRVFDPGKTRKNVAEMRFEDIREEP